MKFQSSVISFPERGHYGDSKYRGNCSGKVPLGFFETYHRRSTGLACDPSIGGGTTVDVAAEMGLRFKGTDLHQGFNLLIDSFSDFLGEEAHSCFWHPPYGAIFPYSGSMWGEPHKWDMSRMNMVDFTEALELAIMNIHAAMEKGGHYGILMGNLRRGGEYYNLSSLVERVTPGKLVDEIIKTQHNCVSDRRQYRGNIVRISHEKLLVFKKDKHELFFLATVEQRAAAMKGITWRAAVRQLLLGGKELSLKELYKAIEPYAQSRDNSHVEAKVRQVVQNPKYFERVSAGVYRLAA
ncbi:TPA: DNA adenine modification methylase [Pseudomonas aeruginosa]